MSQHQNPCDICLDEKCGGTKSCNCRNCSHRDDCRKYLHPTIRITTKCTQACSHCCFSCSPAKTRMMKKNKTTKNISRLVFFLYLKFDNHCSGTFVGSSVGKLFNKSFPFCCKSAATVSTACAFAASSAARRMVSA